jgi:hypothetical protein
MSPPRYVPHCIFGACRKTDSGESAPATTYVVEGSRTWHVCAACAHKIASRAGIEQKKPKQKPKAKAREGAR